MAIQFAQEASYSLSPGFAQWYLHMLRNVVLGRDGILFAALDARLRGQFYHLVREHAHVLTAVTTGLSALPDTGQAFTRTQAMWRFFSHAETTLATLFEPLREAARDALDASSSPVALIIHDWSMLSFVRHKRKADRFQRTGPGDVGYDLGTALLVNAADGRQCGIC